MQVFRIQTEGLNASYQKVIDEMRLLQLNIIEFVLNNIKPICILNNTLYIEYDGNLEDKDKTKRMYILNKDIIHSKLFEVFGVDSISSATNLDKEKLKWLSSLFQEYSPKKVLFNIIK